MKNPTEHGLKNVGKVIELHDLNGDIHIIYIYYYYYISYWVQWDNIGISWLSGVFQYAFYVRYVSGAGTTTAAAGVTMGEAWKRWADDMNRLSE